MRKEEAAARLDEFRVLIDDADRRIVDLLNQRTRVVEQIGGVKRLSGLSVYEPKREEQVFANITLSNGGPLTPEALRRIFERILDEMRTLERLTASVRELKDGARA